ncbi:MAG: hypothetical protein Tsb0020_30080 [Haliangiales bacterium]
MTFVERDEEAKKLTCRSGDFVDRYLILGVLGEGAMGEVYRAYDHKLDRNVALKLLRPRKGRRAKSAAERLEREAQALAKLSHPNIVQVHDVGIHRRVESTPDGGRDAGVVAMFVTMELVEGVSLKEWLSATPRPGWRAILRAYLAACRGLAAAHEVGIVHRDIKPANIMIGKNGRVCVVDFGLAVKPVQASAQPPSAVAAAPSKATEVPPRAPEDRIAISSSDRLTRTGAIMGTPAYMAPEQHMGADVGPGADQYSICVSLYKSLYGDWPFTKRSVAEGDSHLPDLLEAKLHGLRSQPPANSDIPAWVFGVLRRGMAPWSADRYPSMHALIDALESDPIARRRALQRKIAAAVVGCVLVGVGLFGWIRTPKAVDPCARVGEAMVGVWDQATRANIEAAFLATGRSYAADTLARFTKHVDSYVDRWVEMRAAQCHHPEDPLAAEKSLCMARKRSQLDAVTKIFGGASGEAAALDGEMVARAVQAATNLAPLSDCADSDYLIARVPPPDDPQQRERIEALQSRVARLETHYVSGQYERGLAEGTQLLAEVEDLDYPPVMAEILYWTAQLADESSDYHTAEALVERGIRAAADSKDPVLLSEGWALLLYVVGVRQQRIADAQAMMKAMEVFARQADDARAWGHALGNMGIVFYWQGDYDKALSYFQRVPPILLEKFPDGHPDLAVAFSNIGTAMNALGRYDEALAYYHRARQVQEKLLGPNHPDVARALDNVGVALSATGKYDEALESLRRAEAISEAALGSDHVIVGNFARAIGNALLAKGDVAEAIQRFERSLAIQEKTVGTEHPHLAYVLAGLGRALVRQGKLDAAAGHLERARRLHDSFHDPSHPRLAEVLLAQAELALARAELSEAIALSEQALKLENVELRPDVMRVLAEALWARGRADDRERAVDEAKAARDLFASRPNRPKQAEVGAWLSDHPLP